MSADVKDDNKIKSDSDTENREMEIKTTEICHLPFQKEEIENDEAKKIKMQNMTIEVDVTTISINVPIKVKEELTNSRGTTDGTNSEGIRIFIHHIWPVVDYKENTAEEVATKNKPLSSILTDQPIISPSNGRRGLSSNKVVEIIDKQLSDPREEVYSPEDIRIIKPIGSGSFGTVYLW